MNSGKKEYSFLWFIENYSYCGYCLDEELVSPDFTPQGLKGTSWSICLYPGRIKYKEWELDSVYLQRSAEDAGPENFSLKFELSIITENGSTLHSEECDHTFRKGDECGIQPSLDMDELYVRRNTEYLPRDTLGVRCRIWQSEWSVLNVVQQCSARTLIKFEKISFLHKVENFSALKLNEEESAVLIPNHSLTGCSLSSTLYISDYYPRIFVIIESSDSNYKLHKMKVYLIDVYGKNIDYDEEDYRFIEDPEKSRKLGRSLSWQSILKNRKEYLPNDELSLLTECTFSTGAEHTKIEETLHDIPMVAHKHRYYNAHSKNESKAAEKLSSGPCASEDTKVNHKDQCLSNVKLKANSFSTNNNTPSTRPLVTFNQMANSDPHTDKYNAAEKLCTCPSALDDIKELYNDQLLTDVVLKTAAKSFAAHKIVLCARSSVFRSMLTNEMKEKNADCIKVDDLEHETVQQLLNFLYSDNLEELQWESALKLYYAGDKYAIEKLKVLCSSFLVNNINTSTASELLLLADTHSDTELKNFLEDFILEHEKEVFSSDEWEKLSETNPQLVINTMRLKYKRAKGGK